MAKSTKRIGLEVMNASQRYAIGTAIVILHNIAKAHESPEDPYGGLMWWDHADVLQSILDDCSEANTQ